jgi:hypothetical protein
MSIYFTSPVDVIDGDTAYASDLNDLDAATNSAFELVEAQLDAQVESVSKWAEEEEDVPVEVGMFSAKHYSLKAKAWAEENEDVAVEPGMFSSKHYSLKSQEWAEDSEDSAQTAEDAVVLAAAASGTTIYSNATTYNFPDTVIGENGAVYRCMGTNVLGDNPVGSVTGNWVLLVDVAPNSIARGEDLLFFSSF